MASASSVSPTLQAVPRFPVPDRARTPYRRPAWALILAILLASFGTAAWTGLDPGARFEKAGSVTWAILGPSPPRNLDASAGDGYVDLSWDPPADLLPPLGYFVYRGTSPGGEGRIGDTLLLDTSYRDNAVTNGVTYWYYVTASNLDGESNPSNEVPATPGGPPPPTAPDPPQNLQAQGGDGSVSLTWQAPDNNGGSPITNYHIYRGTTPDGLNRTATVGDVRSYSDAGVTNGVTYLYKVTAENDVGEGGRSNVASATPEAPPTPPGPPVNLQATAGDANVQLDWSAPTDNGGSPITNYRIRRGTVSGQLALLAEVPDVRSYLDSSVTNGNTYYYNVTAVNSAGEGPPSNEVSATPMSGDTAPDPPPNLVAIAGDARVSLSWQRPADGGSPITNYKIYRGTSPGGESWLATVASDVLSYADTTVTNGAPYSYYVTAVNIVGESGPSNEVSATPTPAATVPDAVRNLMGEPSNSQVLLTWLPPEHNGGRPITNYRVYRGTSPGDRSSVTTVGDVQTYRDLDLTNGVRYYYVVTAVNEIGEGPPSNQVSAVPATRPTAPRNVRAIPGDGSVTIQWSRPDSDGGAPVTNYRIYRGTVNGSLALVTMIGPIDSYTDGGRMNDQPYYYQVSAVNRVGEGPRSDPPVSATPRAGRTPPGAPPSLIATAGNGSVRLDWMPPGSNGGSPIQDYLVYRGFEPANLTRFPDRNTSVGPCAASCTLTDGTVKNGVTYYYEVTARNAFGEGPRSPLASATPREDAGGTDTTNPRVAITSPPQEETVAAGEVYVDGTASDDTAVVRVDVSSDGATWIAAYGTATWSARIMLSEGKWTIRARVIDSAGNTGGAAVNVTVKPVGPGTTGGFPGGDAGTMTIALAVGSFVVSAAVAWFILDRRRRFWRTVLGTQRRGRTPFIDDSGESPSGGTGPPPPQGTVPDQRLRP